MRVFSFTSIGGVVWFSVGSLDVVFIGLGDNISCYIVLSRIKRVKGYGFGL